MDKWSVEYPQNGVLFRHKKWWKCYYSMKSWKPYAKWKKKKLKRPCIIWFLRRQWHPTPVLLPWKSHGRRSLVGCSPGGHEELDTTERLPFHFSLSWIGEGNGNPLQCSCLENPRDGGAWWAAVYGVAQSWTRLKRLSSSSIWFYSYEILKVAKFMKTVN